MSDPKNEILQHLAKAPALIFLIVAAADGTIDKKEIKQFAKILQDAEFAPLFLAMNQAGSNLLEIIVAAQSSASSPVEDLAILRELLDAMLPADEALAYKMMLLKLAKSIAEASGGFLGIFGSKVSKDEKKAIAVIAAMLGLLEASGAQASAPSGKPSSSDHSSFATVDDLPPNLYPALKSADWARDSKQHVLWSSVLAESTEDSLEPVVAYAIDSPETMRFINGDEVAASLPVADVHRRALQNLEVRLQQAAEWAEVELSAGTAGMGPVSGLALTGDYFASEGMLSESVLKKAHEKLDAALLMVMAPVRGQLYVTKLVSEENPEPERVVFAGWAIKRFFNPDQAPISPNVWISRNGCIVGHVRGMEGLVETAKAHAEKEMQAEEELLTHTAKACAFDAGVGIRVEVVARDVEVLLKNLQHVVRDYVRAGIKRDNFCGQLEVLVDLQDENFAPSQAADALTEQMDDLFDFLNKQFASLGFKSSNNGAINVSYQWS